MTIIRYPHGVYSQEELWAHAAQVSNVKLKAGEEETVIMLPTDLSVIQNDKDLISVISEIKSYLEQKRYKPICHWDTDALGAKPCSKDSECQGCSYYYSEEDERWM